MSIEFPFFAFFLEEKKQPAKTARTDQDGDAEVPDQPSASRAAESIQAPTPKHESKPFRVKGGSKRRRKRSAKT